MTKKISRDSLRGSHKHVDLTDEGAKFLSEHPMFGLEDQYPKTAALLKDLAQKISDGKISPDAADEQSCKSIDEEMAARAAAE
jgi:hypothetical protein